jgi:DNA-binding MarR family transcriptional regulator
VTSPTPAPRRLDTTLAMLLVVAGRSLQGRLESELAGLGLTLRHLGALGHLAHSPELSYSDLARRSRVTSQSMHATVRHLEEVGAVRRALAGQGHRARLEVTERGEELLAAARDIAVALDAELTGDLTEAERATLMKVLLPLIGPGS